MNRAIHPIRIALATLLVVALAGGMNAGPAPALAPRGKGPSASASIILITGDHVVVQALPGGGHTAAVEPGPGREGVSFVQAVHRPRAGREEITLIPADAAPLLASGLLDPDLFNVTKLARQGFGRHGREGLPLILTFEPARARATDSLAAAGLRIARSLESINGVAIPADDERPAALWKWLTGARASAAGLEKVWLDGRAQPLLDQSGPQVGLPAARQAGLTGAGVTIAVLDTGIALDHPDLADRVVASMDFTDTRPDGSDDVGHGTHVAGIMVGTGAAQGGRYEGMAPQANLLNGKVCDEFGCFESWIIDGMEWAAPRARVVNLSLGGEPTDGTDPLSRAINGLTAEHGTLFVVAAGNSGEAESIGSPASADAALAVGSATKQDTLSPFSSRGPRVGDSVLKPELVAPGSFIVSARAAGTPVGDIDPVGESYLRLSGTSMASPHVAGAAALLAQAHPDWTAVQLRAALMSTSVPLAGAGVYDQGAGRIDLARAATQRVFASTGSLEYGLIRWPHDGPPVTKSVTYRNEGETPVALQFSVSFPGHTGPPPAGLLTVSPNPLTVPAGGTAVASVTLTPPALPDGLAGALLTATDGAGIILRTPVGVVGEPESYDLTVTRIGREGPVSNTGVLTVNLENGQSRFTSRFGPDDFVVRLPRGTYDVTAFVSSRRTSPANDVTLLSEPDVNMTADRRVVLDARLGQALAARVDDPAATLRWHIFGLTSGPDGLLSSLTTLILPFDPLPTDRPFAAPTGRTVTSHRYVFRYRPTLGVVAPGPPPPPPDRPPDRARYTLAFAVEGGIPDDVDFEVSRRDLAEVDSTYHAQAVGTEGLAFGLFGSFAHHGDLTPGMTLLQRLPVPSRRTEFFTARGVEWVHELRFRGPDFSLLEFHDHATRYRPGSRHTAGWNRAPLGPSYTPQSTRGPDLSRSQTHIQGFVGLFAGSEEGHTARALAGVSGRTELSRDGVVVGSNTRPCSSFFEVPPSPGTYTLRCVVDRVTDYSDVGTHADVTWTFQDAGPAEQRPLPLLAVRAKGEVDVFGRAPAGRLYPLFLHVQRQPGTPRAAVTALELEVSFDDGASWRRVPVLRLPRSDRALVLLRHPAEAGFVSLRAQATDSRGNRVTQSMIRAYSLHSAEVNSAE